MTDPKEQHDLEKRADSYTNLVTKLGTSEDKSSYTTYIPDRILGPTELSNLYEQDAIAARVIDRVVDDATRESFKLKDTNQRFDFGSVKSELEDLDAVNQLGEAWRWSRLYGGALAIMVVNDGRKFHEPLDLAHATKISAINVVDSTNIIPVGFSPKLGSRAFANPEHYEMVVPFGNERARSIHKSRVIRFSGVRVPASRLALSNGWGPSVLQRVWREIKRLGSVMGYAENLMHELSVMVLGITDLRDMLCGGEENQNQVKTMLQSLKWGIDNLHILALDKEDSFEEITRSVAGVSELIEKFVDALVRGTSMSRLILLGESPGGIGSDSDGQIRGWYDSVSAEQEQKLTPALNQILKVILAIRRNKGEEVPTEWTIEYDPLYQVDEKVQAETNFLLAQTMQLLIVNGIMAPDEARQALINQGVFAPLDTIQIDLEALT